MKIKELIRQAQIEGIISKCDSNEMLEKIRVLHEKIGNYENGTNESLSHLQKLEALIAQGAELRRHGGLFVITSPFAIYTSVGLSQCIEETYDLYLAGSKDIY